jgi:hypothetical protein
MRAGLALLLLLLAACGASPSGDGETAAAGPGDLRAYFQQGGLANVIVVHAANWRPLRSAALVTSDGERVPAYAIDVESSPTEQNPLMQRLESMAPGQPRPVTRVNLMVSTALIRLPDPVRYAREWRGWHVEAVLGDPGAGRETVTLPAPPSPPL